MKDWIVRIIVGKLGPSFRTTLLGLSLILTAVGVAGKALMDDDPKTNPDWEVTSAAILAGWGLMHARDNKVSTEQVQSFQNKGVLPGGEQKG